MGEFTKCTSRIKVPEEKYTCNMPFSGLLIVPQRFLASSFKPQRSSETAVCYYSFITHVK